MQLLEGNSVELLRHLEGKDDGGQILESGTSEYRFSEGFQVLLIDDSSVCLLETEKKLIYHGYKVTKAQEPLFALKLLRDNRMNFDIVITDVHMPEMDGFRLLEIIIRLEIDIPVIIMSSSNDKNLIMKVIQHGACDYLVKPILMKELENIWKHVIRRTKFTLNSFSVAKLEDQITKSKKGHKRHNLEREVETGLNVGEQYSAQKKQRVSWSAQLHKKFMEAVRVLGKEDAVPLKILNYMNIPGITRKHVASHLQKYQNAIKKTAESGESNMNDSSNRVGDFSLNTPLASFSKERHNGINTYTDFRDSGYPCPGMIQYPHHAQTQNPIFIANSHINQNPFTFSMYPSRGFTPQQYSQYQQRMHQNYRVGDVHSNPFMTENQYPQSYSNEPKYRSFPQRSTTSNEYMSSLSNTLAHNKITKELLECISNPNHLCVPLDVVSSQCLLSNTSVSTNLSGGVLNDAVIGEKQDDFSEHDGGIDHTQHSEVEQLIDDVPSSTCCFTDQDDLFSLFPGCDDYSIY